MKLCRVGDVAMASALSLDFAHPPTEFSSHHNASNFKTRPHPHSDLTLVKLRLRYTFQQLLHGKLAPTTTAAVATTKFQPCPRAAPLTPLTTPCHASCRTLHPLFNHFCAACAALRLRQQQHQHSNSKRRNTLEKVLFSFIIEIFTFPKV